MAHCWACHCLLLNDRNKPNLVMRKQPNNYKPSQEIARHDICQQPRQSAAVATHAWTNIYTETMSRISDVYECCLCMALAWSGPQPLSVTNLYCLWATCCWWSVPSLTRDKLSCMLQLHCLHSRLHSSISPSPTECMSRKKMHSCKIYSIWLQASRI